MKAKSLKVLCLILTLVFAAAAFAGCGPSKKTESDTTEKHTAAETDSKYVPDGLPGDLNFDRDIKILTWAETMEDDWSEGETGDAINDAVFKSRESVAERLNIHFDVMSQKGSWDFKNQFSTNLEAYMMAGVEFDLIGQYTPAAALSATKGLMYNLMDLPYLDFSKPWWPGDMTNSCKIRNSLYFCSGDITSTCINAIGSVFVNLDMMAEYGIEENVYDVVNSGEWTLEKMQTMFLGITESSSDETAPVSAILLANRGIYDNLFYGSGMTYVTADSQSPTELVLNEDVMDEKMINWYDACYRFLHDNSDVRSLTNTPKETIETTFMQKKSIVYMSQVLTDAKNYLKSADFEFAVVPYPKYDTAQKDYHSITGYWVTMFSIPTSAKDPNVSAAVLEALASSGYRDMTPKIYEESFRFRFLQNKQNSDMLDLIHDSMTYDTGRIFCDDLGIFNLFRRAHDVSEWVSYRDGNYLTWQANLEKLNSLA